MAIRTSDFNANTAGNLATRLNLGTACSKPDNTSTVMALWFRNRDMAYEQNAGHTILTRAGGASSGNDANIRIEQNGTTINTAFRNVSTLQWSATMTGLELGKTYLLMITARNGWVHLIAAAPGETPIVVSTVNTTLFSLAMTTIEMWEQLYSGTSGTPKPWYGAMEEVNFWHGTFPETSDGVPNDALIRALANGTQDVATLHTLLGKKDDTAGLTDATHQARYPLKNAADLASTVGGAPALTTTNVSQAAGSMLYDSGPLRPVSLAPAYTRDSVSQVVFATPGDAATATAQIRVEGGSYSGLPTMSKMQVRLLDESRAVVRDWIDLTTTAPVAGAGTWAASEGFTGVPMQASFLAREFRAVDSGGTVIAGPVSGYGLSGAGFHLIGQAQSQLFTTVVSANPYALPSGTRFVVARQNGNEPVAGIPELGEPDKPQTPYAMQSYLPAPLLAESVGATMGPRMMAAEVAAIHPGIPVQYTNVALGGTELIQYGGTIGTDTPNELGGRWAGMRTNFGIVQPYIQMLFGHSSGTGGYYAQLTNVLAWSQAKYGTPIRYLHIPVSRYRAAGTGSNFTNTSNSRNGARQFVLDNPGLHWWAGSLSNVFTRVLSAGAEPAGAEPHSDAALFGAGRIGSIIGQALLMTARAVPDVPIGITAVRAVGAEAVIEFGPVNP